MTTIYVKPRTGDQPPEEIKKISPIRVEESKFYYYDEFDRIHEMNHERIIRFTAESKDEAVEAALSVKDTGRYIAIIQVKAIYHVWLDSIDAKICPAGRQVRIINKNA